jgi:hypothetical protein
MSPASPIEMSLGQAVVATFAVTCDGGEADERAGADAAPFLIDLSDDRLTVEAAGTLLGRQGTRYDVIKSPLTMAAIEKRTLCQACSLDDYEWEKQALLTAGRRQRCRIAVAIAEERRTGQIGTVRHSDIFRGRH